MECQHLRQICPRQLNKKRRLQEEENDSNNGNTPHAMEEDYSGWSEHGAGRQFLPLLHSEHVFHTEDWRTPDSALFLPLKEDLLLNVRKLEQISCGDGQFFVADANGKYSRTVTGKVIHLWRYDKNQRKLFISRSFLFTNLQEYLTVQRFLQRI